MKKLILALAMTSALASPALAQAFVPVASPASNATPTLPAGGAYTYTYSNTLTPAASSLAQLCGSAAKSVRLRSITLQGLATTAGGMTFVVRRLSVANTGGSAGASTASVVGAPTPSGAVITAGSGSTTLGRLYDGMLAFPIAGTTTSPIIIKFGTPDGVQPQTLNAASQCVDVFMNGTVPTGAAEDVVFTWTEE